MRLDPATQQAMLAAVPDLRGFAVALCRREDVADDLVQEALLRAIAKIHSFTPGTNMTAWLVTILRNHFCNEVRRQRREISDSDGYFVGTLASQPGQDCHVQFDEFREALAKLPLDQREALWLIGGAGLSYEEAAELCRCPAGTIKSRTNRGRIRLAELMSLEGSQDLGADQPIRAVLSGSNLHWAA